MERVAQQEPRPPLGVQFICGVPRGREPQGDACPSLVLSLASPHLAAARPQPIRPGATCRGSWICVRGGGLSICGARVYPARSQVWGTHYTPGLSHLPCHDPPASQDRCLRFREGSSGPANAGQALSLEAKVRAHSPPSALALGLEDAPQLPHSCLPETFPTLISHNKLPAPTCSPKCAISYCQV